MTTTKEIKNYESRQFTETFQTLLDIAKEIKRSRSELYSLYVKWSNATKDTVESFLKIREEILKHNFNSNVAALTGTSATIVGSVVSIAGIFLALPSAGLSLALTAGGAAMATLGGTVAVGSVITRNVLSKQQCKEAKNVFSEDVTLTESLEKERELYFGLVNKFKNEMDRISNQEVLAKFSELVDIFSKDFILDESLQNSLPPTSIQMDAIKQRDIEQKDLLISLSHLIKLINEDPWLRKLFTDSGLWKIVGEKIKQLAPDIDFRKIFPKGVILQGPAGGSILAGGGMLKSAESLKDIFKGMSMTLRVAMGVLNSIFVIWGIVDLVMTSIDVHKGSKSNESEELLKVAEELKKYRIEVREIMAVTFEWYI